MYALYQDGIALGSLEPSGLEDTLNICSVPEVAIGHDARFGHSGPGVPAISYSARNFGRALPVGLELTKSYEITGHQYNTTNGNSSRL